MASPLRRRSWRWWIVAVPHLGLLIPLVVALAALSGIGHRWVDILAQFVAPTLMLTILGTFGLLLVRFRRPAAQAAATAAVLLIAVWPQWSPRNARIVADAPAVRLYSANVFYRNNDVARIRRSIEEARPDIVVLIELGRRPAGRIDEILADYPYRAWSIQPDVTRGPARSVIASRWPLAPHSDRPDGLHDVSATIRSPLGPLNVVGVHLTRPWPFQYQWGQINQVAALQAVIADFNGPVIVAGDFNSVSNARIGRQMKRDLGLAPAGGFPGTWPSSLPPPFGMTIDQVWRSPDLAFVSRRIGRATGSDHRPVVTEITRAAP